MKKINKKQLYIGSSILIVVLLIWIFSSSGDKKEMITVPVKQGKFEITVNTTGELQAKHSKEITAPAGLRKAGVWNIAISNLVAEGTLVNEGDFIAALDRSEVTSRLKELENELQKMQSQNMQTKLDTALQLRETRDQLINLKYALEEREIALKQSQYEPPATIRQAEIDLDKAKRAYDQALENYEIKLAQAEAKMQEVSASLSILQMKYQQIVDLLQNFDIHAPKDGMVIYHREWNGKKRTVGAKISPWDPTVATLPDLSRMICITYVNEVDISKIKKGQPVRIQVDAFPDKIYNGSVISVANVGEQRPNSEAKVFEVKVDVLESDSILRPAMSTRNTVIAATYEDRLFVPLEAVHPTDSLSYVFKKDGLGFVKQEVIPGTSNENEVIIKEGLEEGDKVYLAIPEDASDKKIKRLQNT